VAPIGFSEMTAELEKPLAWMPPPAQAPMGCWHDVFKQTLGHASVALISELRDVRKRGYRNFFQRTMPTAPSTRWAPLNAFRSPSR